MRLSILYCIFVAKFWRELRTGHPFDHCEEVRKDVLTQSLRALCCLLFWQRNNLAQYTSSLANEPEVCDLFDVDRDYVAFRLFPLQDFFLSYCNSYGFF